MREIGSVSFNFSCWRFEGEIGGDCGKTDRGGSSLKQSDGVVEPFLARFEVGHWKSEVL